MLAKAQRHPHHNGPKLPACPQTSLHLAASHPLSLSITIHTSLHSLGAQPNLSELLLSLLFPSLSSRVFSFQYLRPHYMLVRRVVGAGDGECARSGDCALTLTVYSKLPSALCEHAT